MLTVVPVCVEPALGVSGPEVVGKVQMPMFTAARLLETQTRQTATARI